MKIGMNWHDSMPEVISKKAGYYENVGMEEYFQRDANAARRFADVVVSYRK